MASHLYCNFLQPDKIERHAFTAKPTELAHVNEQVNELDHHISDSFKFRSALLHRSNQLTSPTYVLPSEVLSYVFCLTNEMFWRPPYFSIFVPQKAMILTAVSYLWRQVALSTPKLWERVDCMCTGKLYRNSSLLIQHCASYASSLDMPLFEESYELDRADGTFDTMTTVLSSSDVTGKLKSLKLKYDPPPQWIRLLPSFLRLESLTIEGGRHPSIDLSSLPLLSQVHLSCAFFDSLILPPSVLMLHLYGQPTQHSIALLYNCPRLVEFSGEMFSEGHMPPLVLDPLVLDSLKTLLWSPARTFVEVASATELKIPVIENLELRGSEGLRLAPLTLLCHQFSASLKSLIFKSFLYTTDWSTENLRHLFQFPIPTLRKLSLMRWSHEFILRAIRALTPRDGEDGYKDRCLPKLRYLLIDNSGSGYEPCDFDFRILDLVKRRRTGEDSPFHLVLSSTYNVYNTHTSWDPELMEEFREFVANRQIEITVGVYYC